jgi:type I restriction enzyme S subunit
VPQGFAFVSEDQAREYGPQHVRGGDLVFTCWGTIGQVGLIPYDGPFPEYIISNKQLKLRVNPDIANPLFCFYYLASPAGAAYIRNRGIGGAVPGINLGILKAMPIALPKLEVQREIAGILSAYDDLIENNRRRMALLEESARLLYQEWFVRLRFPGHEHTRIVNGVPEGWERTTLGTLCRIRRGASPRPIQAYTKREELVNSVSDGSTQKNLNTDAAGRLPVVVPPSDSLTREFDAIVQPLFSQVHTLARWNDRARGARDLLLPRLMSGEIVV